MEKAKIEDIIKKTFLARRMEVNTLEGRTDLDIVEKIVLNAIEYEVDVPPIEGKEYTYLGCYILKFPAKEIEATIGIAERD